MSWQLEFLVMGDYNLSNVYMFSNNDGLQFEDRHPKGADLLFNCFTLNEFGQFNSFLMHLAFYLT